MDRDGHRPRRLAIGGILMLAAAGAVVGCGQPRDASVERLLPAAEGRLHLEDHLDSRRVFDWGFEGSDLEDWTISAPEPAEVREGMLWIRARDSHIERAVDFAAEDVDTIVIEGDGLARSSSYLFWAGPGETFGADRMLLRSPGAAGDRLHTFRVGVHSEWKGPITRLRWAPRTPSGGRVGVFRIAADRYAGAVRASVFAGTWRVSLSDEVRTAAIVAAERPFGADLRAGPDAMLHFALGLVQPPATGDATTMSVVEITAAGERELFSRPLPAVPRWQDFRVNLASRSTETVRMEFRIDGQPGSGAVAAVSGLELRTGGADRSLPNVVLISIDTLRADRMSLYGNLAETTPNIDRWARSSGVTFTRAVAPASRTLPSHVAMFTGIGPIRHGVNFLDPAPDALRFLAEDLHERGYWTVASTGGGFVGPSYGFDQGFDAFRAWQAPSPRARAEVVAGVDRALEFLAAADERPFFLLFHTYEVHMPFNAREPYFSEFLAAGERPDFERAVTHMFPPSAEDGYTTRQEIRLGRAGESARPMREDERASVLALYDSGVAFADAHVGRLLDALQEDERFDDTLVILTSDHGENLGERGMAGHGYLSEENVHVPLVISYPRSFEGGGRVDEQVRLVDLVPTVLDLLGLEARDDLDGRTLLPLLVGDREPPRDAWTYTATSNNGVSLRLGTGFEYRYDDTFWARGPRGRREWIGTRGGEGVRPTAPSEEELRSTVEGRLEQRPGLHLLLRNDSANTGDLEFRLTGPALQLSNLKATGLDCDCVSGGAGAAQVVLAPGEEIRLQLADGSHGRLEVVGTIGERAHAAVVEGEPGMQPAALAWKVEGWEAVDPTQDRLATGVALWWQGAVATSSDQEVDERVLQRLRALGYLQ